MFSKFKKVLVSLALASSLALAPMNVSAANSYNGPIEGTGTVSAPGQNSQKADVNVPVYLTGSASVTPEYTVEISPQITINLNDETTLASDLESTPAMGNAGIYMKLTGADDFGGKNLKVTPAFAALAGTTEIEFSATINGKDDTVGQEKETLSGLGVTNGLLKFGTYTNGSMTTGTDIASFAESDLNTVKSVKTYVDPTEADTIKRKIPDEITDANANKSTSTPKIAANQQVGNVTFTCEIS